MKNKRNSVLFLLLLYTEILYVYGACPKGFVTSGLNCLNCPAGKQCSSATATDCLDGEYSLEGRTLECVVCSAGYKCPTKSAQPIICPIGYYSASGSKDCTICQKGFSCHQSLSPVACPLGHYSFQSDTICLPCIKGYACTNTLITKCTNGQYSELYEMLCTICPIGSACDGYSKITCSTGFHTNGLSGQSKCTPCSPGFTCSSTTASSLACAADEYSTNEMAFCEKCPAGYECIGKSFKKVCPLGYYSAVNSITCTICPKGYYCPVTAAINIKCPKGTYNDVTGRNFCLNAEIGKYVDLEAQFVSKDCASGYYAVEEKLSICTACELGYECTASTRVACKPGQYSLGLTSKCTNCEAGFYCPTTTQKLSCIAGSYSLIGYIACLPCPTGKTCTNTGSLVQCTDGKYMEENVGGATCIDCPAGSYCPNINQREIKTCINGQYCPTNSIIYQNCPVGKFCSTPKDDPVDCPSGTYSFGRKTQCDKSDYGFFSVDLITIIQICSIGKYASTQGATACSSCQAGYYCPAGTIKLNPTKALCMKGFYCSNGGTIIPCPAGTYGQKHGATSEVDGCATCPSGYYCLEATVYPADCLPGHYCPTGTQEIKGIKCGKGKYQDLYNAKLSTDCKPCNAGRYCLEATSSQDCSTCTCPVGSYCLAGTLAPVQCIAGKYTQKAGSTSVADCIDCPKGYYCTLASPFPIPCPKGTYNNVLGSTQLSACVTCTTGKICNKDGLETPNASCPQGHYCPLGTQDLKSYPCPAGTINDSFGKTQLSDCVACPAGKSCSIGTGGSVRPLPCSIASYCPAGTSQSFNLKCLAGTWSDRINLISATDCYQCPRGKYCPIGTKTPLPCPKGYCCPFSTKHGLDNPCLAGTYSSTSELESCNQCKSCPVGNYCVKASTVPKKCSIGTYNPNRLGKTISDCLKCTAGYYCPIGTTNPQICAPGTYSREGLGSCSSCIEGRYCDKYGTTFSMMYDTNICPSGMICPSGLAYIPNLLQNTCTIGYYCPKGTINTKPIPCPIGTYSDVTGLKAVEECKSCKAGSCCPTMGMISPNTKCVKGYYCPEKTGNCKTYACPQGTYRSMTGATSFQDCQPCPSGKYCDTVGLEIFKDCKIGHFCPANSRFAQPCPIGTYSNSIGLVRMDQCVKCPGGKYCAGVGLNQPTDICDAGYICKLAAFSSAPYETVTGTICPAGFYCTPGTAAPTSCSPGKYVVNAGAKTKFDCIPAQPGKYSTGSGAGGSPLKDCAAGFFCTGGSAIPNQHETEAGHFSIAGSFRQTPCPSGYYQPEKMGENCIKCTKGYYCPTVKTITPIKSQMGKYSPEASSSPIDCPKGTFLGDIERFDLTHCSKCTAGKACSVTGLSAPNLDCQPGYYCTTGAQSDAPTGQNGNKCLKGHYCPSGTRNYMENPCPIGTYSSTDSNTIISNCKNCDAGKYCDSLGMFQIAGSCSSGYFCTSKAKKSKPEDGVTGGPCPKNTFCVAGTVTPSNCADGKYQNNVASSACLTCYAGYYCISGADPVICPKGKYCPSGTGSSIPLCPVGTYNPSLGLTSASLCMSCHAKYYCSKPGLTKFDIVTLNYGIYECDKGYYCVYGNSIPNPSSDTSSSKGGICPAGYICAKGTDTPIPCPEGTYRSQTGGSDKTVDCKACDSGKYCDVLGSTTATKKCYAGYFCLSGSNIPNPTDTVMGGICGLGKYCPIGSSSEQT
ncbi:hypothetical protein A3Q56_04909, partial [Intoshia linei]